MRRLVARPRRPAPSGRATALTAVALLLAACGPDDRAGRSTGEEPPSSSPPGDLVQATRLADVATEDTMLVPGLYALGFSTDQDDVPMVLVDVPSGYLGRGDGYEITAADESFSHFDTWTVSEVAAQPCGATTWVDPGPTAEDLATALAALPVWESTRPVPTTVGGHDGVVMELNVPSRIPPRCHGDLFSWREHSGGMQGIAPGKTQRLWILDVDGHRLMLVIGYFPGPDGPSPERIGELTRMAEEARFVDADQVAP